MIFNQIKTTLFPVIKVISTVLIISAITWELGNIYATSVNYQIPDSLNPIFWIGRFALTSHFLEGIIAAVYAIQKNKKPISYGIYTFFIGTIGLIELFLEKDENLANVEIK
ncbi:hypothetical protein [Fortiea contorta]|uniref:hypothetical protein n=1 Tax=Fortiea contorta TaxID=1892405 RepID=UPI0003497794|nr:hypothetical protein [Fortiea contorta]